MKKDYIVNTEKVDLLPALEIKFKWRGSVELIPFDSKVLMRMPRRRDLNGAILNATSKYVTTLTPNLRHYIDKKILKTLEYFIERKMIVRLDSKLYPYSHTLLNRFYDENSILAVMLYNHRKMKVENFA